MRLFYTILVICIFLVSCEESGGPYKNELIGIPTAFVIDSRYISHNSTELVIEMDIGALTWLNRDYPFINDSAFKGRYVPLYTYIFNSIELIDAQPQSQFSTILAMDQSGSYDNFDPMNQRLRSLNKMMIDHEANPVNEFGMAYFSRSSLFKNNLSVLQDTNGNPFTLSKNTILENQYWMTFNEEGTSNMYDAMSALIDKTDSFATKPNKSITFYVHSIDDYKGANYQDVIDKAITKGVKINIINIGPINKEYNEICIRTGGFLHLIDSRTIAEAMDKGTPALVGISRILSNNIKIYRVRFTLKRNLGTYKSGSKINEYLFVGEHDLNGEELIYNPLGYYIEIP